MTHINTVKCPLCGSLPYLVLAGGRQAFCSHEECPIIVWDMLATLDENLEGLQDELLELAQGPRGDDAAGG